MLSFILLLLTSISASAQDQRILLLYDEDGTGGAGTIEARAG
jgi:hypothetical protein